MAKYSKAAKKGVATAIKRMEKGKLQIGGSGKKVTDKKQAIAIGLSEAKKKGARVPAKKATAPKKAVAKKSAPKKSPVKKAAPKKVISKKPVASKGPAKKVAVKKSFLKKAPAQKVPAKKVAVKKAVSKKDRRGSKTATVAQKPMAVKETDINSSSNIPPVTQNIQEKPIEHVDTMPAAVEDPIKTTDQNVYNKATSKMDPKHNMTVSSIRKGNIKPSGKKPLW